MSTYTDLKNRVKETITVGFRPEDRVTTQKVRFYNEENEYWGSFSGSLSGKIDIYKGKLSSVDIYDATLVNPVIKTGTGMIIELGTMADQLEELSVYAHEDLSGAISSCISAIRGIQDAISAVPVDTADKLRSLSSIIDGISSAVDSEVSARVSSDQGLSVEFAQRIRDLAVRMAGEDSGLRGLIYGISAAVGDEVSARVSADADLSASLMSYADGRRHYDLTAMDAAPQMPIKAKEFAVNRLIDYDLPNGFVVDQDRNELVGWVEAYGSGTGDCRFTAYADAEYPVDYKQMLGVNPYMFDSGVSVRQCPDAVHQLVYSKSAEGELFDNCFDVRVLMPNVRMLRHDDGRTIGYIYNAGTANSVSAGTLQFIPSQLVNDPVLSGFANDKEITFSVNNDGGRILSYVDCELQLISSSPAFSYRVNLSSWNRAVLSGGFQDYYARIYQNLIERDNDGRLKAFSVSMVPKHAMPSDQRLNFRLNLEEGFRSVLHEYDDGSFDVLEYADGAVSYFNEKKYFSCPVRVHEHGRRFDIPLRSLQANAALSASQTAEISFAILSDAVADALSPLLSAVYPLRRVGDTLQFETATALEDGGYRESVTIQVRDSGRVFASFEAGNGSRIMFDDVNCSADFTQQNMYVDSSTRLASYDFDVDSADYSGVDQLDGGHGIFRIGSAVQEGDEYLGLKIVDEYGKSGRQSYKANEIVIEIPDKDEGSTLSREFLFVIRPRGAAGRKAVIKFVTSSGDPIRFFSEGRNTFEIECEKFVTFRLQEIVSGKFALLDWDQSMQESRLDYLDLTLNSEISNRISAVSDLSVKLSGEISGLSTALSGEVDRLSARLSGEISSLSTALSGEIDTLSVKLSGELSVHSEQILSNRTDIDFLLSAEHKSMVYLGTLLSVDDKHLSCYFENALGFHAEPSFKFKHGFTFRISAEQTDLYGRDGVRISFHPNDVLTFNRDTELSAVCAGDVDVINDYNAELYDLSAALCAEIRDLSIALSGEVGILSTKLSGEISGLSSELVGLISSTSSDITGIISSVSSNISAAADEKFALSSDLSALSGNFGDLKDFVDRTIYDRGESKPGVVKMVDEHPYDGEFGLRNYEMHMISGTIMLVKIA